MNDQPRRRRRIAPRADLPEAAAAEAAPIPTVEERRQEIPADDMRQDMRSEQREESSRERADRLSAEILARDEQVGDFVDKFPMPEGGPPDGFHYEWKKKSVMGFEDRSYAITLATNGWRPVPAERHPEFMPVGGTHLAIEREGLILMEIPTQVMKVRQNNAYQRARDQINIKQKQMNQAPAGHFERDNKGNSMVNIKRSYEPLQIPTDRPKT
jgi:hypothetical protein